MPGKITGGLYLVVDPKPGNSRIMPKVEAALRGGVDVLQVWNNWAEDQDPVSVVNQMCRLAEPWNVPVLVHENMDLLCATAARGIHFDSALPTLAEIRDQAGRPVLCGVTCGNDLDRVRWAIREGADYISFCAMFPSPSVAACALVSLDTVRAARALGPIPIFTSGGITPENAGSVLQCGADGIAVISGILGADNPETAARDYVRIIQKHTEQRIKS